MSEKEVKSVESREELPLNVRQRVEEALKSIIDPELYIDIWTLGLIYDVEISEPTANIRMTFTSMACPAGPQLVDQVRKKVTEVDEIEEVEVEVVFDPPWEPSEELKGLMGLA
ncbi:UNVERIFIED_CONTAM: hypothetical protein GTU68_028107 [Idotea baltica]|nr:hypothetical protein [Idotea baltica]